MSAMRLKALAATPAASPRRSAHRGSRAPRGTGSGDADDALARVAPGRKLTVARGAHSRLERMKPDVKRTRGESVEHLGQRARDAFRQLRGRARVGGRR